MKSNLRRTIIGCFAVGLLLSGLSGFPAAGAEQSVQFNQNDETSMDGVSDLNERMSRARTPEWFRIRGRIKVC